MQYYELNVDSILKRLFPLLQLGNCLKRASISEVVTSERQHTRIFKRSKAALLHDALSECCRYSIFEAYILCVRDIVEMDQGT